MKTLFLISAVMVLFGCRPAQKIDDSTAYKLGYKDGYLVCSMDAWAVDSYHRQADALTNDDDPIALSSIWSNCLAQATRTESQWNSMSITQKLAYPIRPFYKSNNGEPRRISKSQKEAFVKALKGEK